MLDRVAQAAGRKRSQFIGSELLKAILEAEEVRTRAAYGKHPDSESEADDWSTAELAAFSGQRSAVSPRLRS